MKNLPETLGAAAAGGDVGYLLGMIVYAGFGIAQGGLVDAPPMGLLRWGGAAAGAAIGLIGGLVVNFRK